MLDIATLVKEALMEGGCDEKMLLDFDGHSTIALDFESQPSILIAEREGHVIMFSRIAEYNSYIVEQSASRLLALLMEDVAYSITGKYHLTEHESYVVLNYILPESALNKVDFSNAIEEFYTNIQKYTEVFR